MELSPKQRASIKESPYRNRTVTENESEFNKMYIGDYQEGDAVLRLKYKSTAGFHDPVAYRINKKPHCVTNKDWNIYPTYDFSHPICDSLEGIGLSLCSKEFSTHRELYEWLLRQLELSVVDQREFNRLSLPNNITSKRGVIQIKSSVIGDDDPRLLTVSGLRRRGFPAKTINQFVSSSSDELQLSHLFDLTSRYFDTVCPRRIVVLDPLKCYVTNYEEFLAHRFMSIGENQMNSSGGIYIHFSDHPMHPQGRNRLINLKNELYINRFDFVDNNE